MEGQVEHSSLLWIYWELVSWEALSWMTSLQQGEEEKLQEQSSPLLWHWIYLVL